MPKDVLQARVVMLYKKGDTSKLENFRPISLLNSLYKMFAAILLRRLADKLDRHLQKTQYGFRKHRSTADAIQCIRRIAEFGEQTQTKAIMVLLDWEKAFDKVTRKGLFTALARMGVPSKLQKLVGMLYRDPTFRVEVDGQTSEWHSQQAGIRQGCPLSPYLFLVVMTVLFHDVHSNDSVNTVFKRVPGFEHDEVLYADDTICFIQTTAAMNRLLHVIETE